jgi:uncharacterized Fe-S center protein
MAASFDPVALDQASADMVNAAPALPGSIICDNHNQGDLKGSDKLTMAHPDISWLVGLEHAEKIGLGSRKYNLIEV